MIYHQMNARIHDECVILQFIEKRLHSIENLILLCYDRSTRLNVMYH